MENEDSSSRESPLRLESPNDISFSINLLNASHCQLDFLRLVESNPLLYSEKIIAAAVKRYEFYWLPLASKVQSGGGRPILAPLDIAWVWHVHMLSPTCYISDCKKICGKVVDHWFYRMSERDVELSRSNYLWESEYGKSCPFDIDLHRVNESDPEFAHTLWSENIDIAESLISYDISSAAQRQRSFTYQVSLPHYNDPKFLSEAIKRYQKFIFLKSRNPDTFLVPCYDFDLIWHGHQCHPLAYAHDMSRLLNKVLKHDDSVNDRSEGSKLVQADATTRELWKQEYGEVFSLWGAMYRGLAPEECLEGLTKQEYIIAATKRSEITLDSVQLINFSDELHGQNFCLSLHTYPRNALIAKLSGPGSVWHVHGRGLPDGGSRRSSMNEYSGLSTFTFDTSKEHVLAIKLYHNSGFLFKRNKNLIGQGFPLLAEVLDRLTASSSSPVKPFSLCDTVRLMRNRSDDTGIQVSYSLTLSPPVLGPILLSVKSGSFDMSTLREVLSRTIPVHRQAIDNPSTCLVANHNLVNAAQSTILKCQVIHSVAYCLSAVQIYSNEKVAAVAHLIGSDTIPDPTQVTLPVPTLIANPQAGQRAMLIKGSSGDYGICIACWISSSDMEGSSPARVKSRGSQRARILEQRQDHDLNSNKINLPKGYLQLKFYNLKNDVEADIANGKVKVHQRSQYAAENIALAFSVSVLYVLCQPRSTSNVDKRSPALRSSVMVDRSIYDTGKMPPHKKPQLATGDSGELVMLIAAGYLCQIPSNTYLLSGQAAVMGHVAGAVDIGCDVGGCGACAACGSGGGGCGTCGGCGACGAGCGGCGGCAG